MSRARLVAAEAAAITDGLWLLNAGGPMTTAVDGVNGGQPITLVVDLATLAAAAPRIVAMREHCGPIGSWTDIAIDERGARARLALMRPTGDEVADSTSSVRDAAEIAAQLAAGIPLQASIGAEPDPARGGSFERIAAPTVVNGRDLNPADYPLPLHVLRAGKLVEASVCIFGADATTGRIAASKSTEPKEPTVATPDLKARLDALTARLGAKHRPSIALLMAEGATDEQVATQIASDEQAAMDAEMAKLRDEIAALKAANAELTSKLAALTKPAAESAPINASSAGAASAVAASAHTPEGRAQLMRAGVRLPDGKTLRGWAALNHLNAAAAPKKD